jgi:hypothetical protein
MADNVAITAGAGTTISTDDVGSGVQVQRVKVQFGADGAATDVHNDNPFPVIERGIPTYFFSSALAAGAAGKIYMDIFNATGSGKIAKLRGLYVISNSAAVVGVPIQWTLARTTAVGTGGTALTAGVGDLSDPAIPAQVTARHAPTGGATTGGALFDFWNTSEETLPMNALGSITNWCIAAPGVTPITFREGQGIKLTHVTSSTTGSWMVTAAITLE